MTTANKEFIEFTERELTVIVLHFINTIEENKASQISKEIVKLIDWNNSALMHKGLSWMVKNYLIKENLV